MTTKSRDKWLPALLLAGIVHVIVFAALYVNYANKNNPVATETNINSAQPSQPDTTSQPTALVSETEIREVPVVDGSPNQSTESQSASNAQNSSTEGNRDSDNTANTVSNDNKLAKSTADKTSDESKVTVKSTGQAADIAMTQKATPDSDITTPSNPLTTQRSNAGLLDMDMPSQNSNGKTTLDKDYNKTKSETEELNAKMSSGINEIKNRTQKRIEEAEAMQAYAHAVDNGRPSVALSSKPASSTPAAKTPLTENTDTISSKAPSNRLTTATED